MRTEVLIESRCRKRRSGNESAAHSGVKLAPRACRRQAGIGGNGAAPLFKTGCRNAGAKKKHDQANKELQAGHIFLSGDRE